MHLLFSRCKENNVFNTNSKKEYGLLSSLKGFLFFQDGFTVILITAWDLNRNLKHNKSLILEEEKYLLH